MSIPYVPAGLPTSDVVLSHFGDFCKAEPVRSIAPDCVAHFGDFLDGRVTPELKADILKRAEYPL